MTSRHYTCGGTLYVCGAQSQADQGTLTEGEVSVQ
jgi:hypothetical protein